MGEGRELTTRLKSEDESEDKISEEESEYKSDDESEYK